MTAKRFRSGFAKYDEFSDEIIDELTGKHYFDSTKDDYVFSEEIVDLLNELHEENQYSKEFIEQLQEELVLFKEAGANMGIDLNAQITALKQENEQLKQELLSKNDVIQQLQNNLKTDDRDELLKYRRKFSDACIELSDLNRDIRCLNRENEQLKKENSKQIVEYNGLNCEYGWLKEENEKLKREVEYWKQVASQYSNQVNVDEHIRLNGWKNDR